jgi:hypothetical protein
MRNEDASPRHRIEAARELRQTAIGTGSENTRSDSGERFTITINLGADEKIVVDAGKIAPHAPHNWEGSDVVEG